MTWRGWTIVALGLWLIAAPFALGYTAIASAWSDQSVGLVIVVMGVWAAFARTAAGVVALSSVIAVAGLWVAIASFVFAHLPPAAALWNDVIVGVAVLGLGAVRAMNPEVRRRA